MKTLRPLCALAAETDFRHEGQRRPSQHDAELAPGRERTARAVWSEWSGAAQPSLRGSVRAKRRSRREAGNRQALDRAADRAARCGPEPSLIQPMNAAGDKTGRYSGALLALRGLAIVLMAVSFASALRAQGFAPRAALERMTLAAGFEASLVAHEPMMAQPVCIE